MAECISELALDVAVVHRLRPLSQVGRQTLAAITWHPTGRCPKALTGKSATTDEHRWMLMEVSRPVTLGCKFASKRGPLFALTGGPPWF